MAATTPGSPTEATPQPAAVQEQLDLDEPVPYRLTSGGRRAVAPAELPVLRIVASAVDSRVRPADVGHVDLDRLDPSLRARARALRRAGNHTLDIADELDLPALHVEAWVADLPVPAAAGRRRRLRMLRDAADGDDPAVADGEAAASWAHGHATGRAAALERLDGETLAGWGIGLVAGILVPDRHALVLMSDEPQLLRAGWRWATGLVDGPVALPRVLAFHDPDLASDRVAHDVAKLLRLDPSGITTSRDAARAGRPAMLRIRATDPQLAGLVLGWRDALLARLLVDAG